ncbi:hypothetical protein P175DRAFT_0530245 [Aspergillus ochraceoroseus IBT 24754]|uniref:Uncharacterized protein n=1 Tax=Aspergillus ochraceoroseus IBT 24754 TaxID=1392256 RepID=A0A2T5M3M3_9EURO|nr:uncharacterized protein P175DRAFT_0530245 [Aspergillus ochraceoroseus IBT 24754]PTU23145.1 hypothetical protein P175DRAFT_0530245 [Aspergillus ochraceoroseus IBT 24754]
MRQVEPTRSPSECQRAKERGRNIQMQFSRGHLAEIPFGWDRRKAAYAAPSQAGKVISPMANRQRR